MISLLICHKLMERKKEETFEKKINRIYFNARDDLIDRSLHGKRCNRRQYSSSIMAEYRCHFMQNRISR